MLSSVMYSSTYHKMKKQSKNIALQKSAESRTQEIRILVCTVTSIILLLINNFIPLQLDNVASQIALISTIFVFQINFAVNPLIYFLRLPNYQKTFCAIYCRRRTASN